MTNQTNLKSAGCFLNILNRTGLTFGIKKTYGNRCASSRCYNCVHHVFWSKQSNELFFTCSFEILKLFSEKFFAEKNFYFVSSPTLKIWMLVFSGTMHSLTCAQHILAFSAFAHPALPIAVLIFALVFFLSISRKLISPNKCEYLCFLFITSPSHRCSPQSRIEHFDALKRYQFVRSVPILRVHN